MLTSSLDEVKPPVVMRNVPFVCVCVQYMALSDTRTHQSEANLWPTLPLQAEKDVGGMSRASRLPLKLTDHQVWEEKKLTEQISSTRALRHTHTQPLPEPRTELFYLLLWSNSSFWSRVRKVTVVSYWMCYREFDKLELSFSLSVDFEATNTGM